MATPTRPRTSDSPPACLDPQAPRLKLTVVLGNGCADYPPALRHLRPVVTRDLGAVRATSTVVALCGAGMAGACRELSAAAGRLSPRVLMVAPTVDPTDVVDAFRNGATSYLLDSADPPSGAACLPCAVRGTAYGEAHLHPAVAAVLIARLHRRGDHPTAGRRRHPDVSGGVLSERERDVMEALVLGHSPVEIAVRLSLAEKTVRNYLSNIYKKLQVRSQAQAVLCWLDRPPYR